jgi:hypothetical protein
VGKDTLGWIYSSASVCWHNWSIECVYNVILPLIHVQFLCICNRLIMMWSIPYTSTSWSGKKLQHYNWIISSLVKSLVWIFLNKAKQINSDFVIKSACLLLYFKMPILHIAGEVSVEIYRFLLPKAKHVEVENHSAVSITEYCLHL